MSIVTIKKNAFYKLSVSAFTLFIAANLNVANAQSVDLEFNNATVENACGGVLQVPSVCGTEVRTVLPPTTAPTMAFPNAPNDALLIGATLNNDHTGNTSGRASVSGGGEISTENLYAGFEGSATGTLDVGGVGSKWINAEDTYIGLYGKGVLYVTYGGYFETKHLYTSYHSGARSEVLIAGVDYATGTRAHLALTDGGHVLRSRNSVFDIYDGALMSSGGTLYIGEHGSQERRLIVSGVDEDSGYSATIEVTSGDLIINGGGTLWVEDGALADITENIIVGGLGGTSIAALVLWDRNTDLNRNASLYADNVYLGQGNKGIMDQRQGGYLEANNLYVADGANADIKMYSNNRLGADRATTLIKNDVEIGRGGRGLIDLKTGAFMKVEGGVVMGLDAAGIGDINVFNNNTLLDVDGDIIVGQKGHGGLFLSTKGTIKAQHVYIAEEAGSSGTVHIGYTDAAGIMDTATITGLLGDAEVAFYHTDDIDFAPVITGTARVTKARTDSLTTLTSKSDYTGNTDIARGTLRAGGANYLSENSDFILRTAHTPAPPTLDLNGNDQKIKSLSGQGGTLKFGGTGGTTLTITDFYQGVSTTGLDKIEFNTVLGGDNSLTDKIIVKDTSGKASIQVTNHGGIGAFTTNGIKLIDVLGQSNGVFELLGEYEHQGQQAIVAGAFSYKLFKGGANTPNDGDWYLRSQLTIPVVPDPHVPVTPDPHTDPKPLYHPGVPVYELYPQALLAMNEVSTLRQRIGSRTYIDSAERETSLSSGDGYTSMQGSGTGVWLSGEGAHEHMEPRHTKSDTTYNNNQYKIHVGADILLMEGQGGNLVGTLFGRYVNGRLKASSAHGHGKIKTDGYGGGAALTWYGDQGLYIDGQANAMWYRSDLSSDLVAAKLANHNDGVGYAFSLEGGQQLGLTQRWSIIPQGQLAYSHVNFDSFTDAFDVNVRDKKGDSLQGRLGLAFEYKGPSITYNQRAYAIANIHYEFLDGTNVKVADQSFASKNERLWAGIGVGGEHRWNNDRYALYGEANLSSSVKHFADSYAAKGTVGLRVKW